MSIQEITELLSKGFLPKNVSIYRQLYKEAFNKEPASCSCNNNKIYMDIKLHYKIK